MSQDVVPADPGYARAIPPVVTLLVLAAYGLAGWVAMSPDWELAWLRDLPRADAASATDGPAIYAGKLRGPEGRVTPSGDRAAAYWWRVARSDDDSETVFCWARERSRLALETPTGSLRVAFAEADPNEVGLITDEKDNEHGRAIAIDLGHAPRSATKSVPAGTCLAEDATYDQLMIPEGADVEVVGCVRDGVIHRCDTPLAGVVSMPNLTSYRRHRLDNTVGFFLFPLLFSAVTLLIAGIVLILPAAEMMRAVRPGKDV